MNRITSIFSLLCLLVMILLVVVSVKIANAQDVEAELPVKVGIAQCGSGEEIQANCERNAACCALIEPQVGDTTTAPWTPEEETRDSYVPDDVVIVE